MILNSRNNILIYIYAPLFVFLTGLSFFLYTQIDKRDLILEDLTVDIIERKTEYNIGDEIKYIIAGNKLLPCEARGSKFLINQDNFRPYYAGNITSDLKTGPFRVESSVNIPSVKAGEYLLQLNINYPFCNQPETARYEANTTVNILSNETITIE